MPLTADFSASADDAGGLALDAGFSISPTERLTLNAGAGHSRGSAETADLRGTLLNAGGAWSGDRGGFAIAFDVFDDSSNYHAATLGARAWVRAGDFQVTLLGRRRDLGVELTLDLPTRTLRRDAEFSAIGGGLQVGFSHGNFDAYVTALEYDYDKHFDDFMALLDSSLLDRRPRIEALIGSFLTQAQGAIDRQSGFGMAYGFGRNSISADFSAVHDAVLNTGSTSVALSWRHAQSAHVDWTVTGGMADSDEYGTIAFFGVGLGLAN